MPSDDRGHHVAGLGANTPHPAAPRSSAAPVPRVRRKEVQSKHDDPEPGGVPASTRGPTEEVTPKPSGHVRGPRHEVCTVALCDRPTKGGRRHCPGHASRWEAHGDVRADVPLSPRKKRSKTGPTIEVTAAAGLVRVPVDFGRRPREIRFLQLPTPHASRYEPEDILEAIIETIEEELSVELRAACSMRPVGHDPIYWLLRRHYADELTLEQAGRLLGVCRERIRQIEAKALAAIRKLHKRDATVALEGALDSPARDEAIRAAMGAP